LDNQNLKKKTQLGLIWDFSGSMARQLAAFAISILLARLLSPSEFGIIGMAMVFISLTDVFIDVGFTDGIVQRKDVTNSMLSSVFYINLVVSLFLTLIIIGAAPSIGSFYDNRQVTEVLYYLSVIPPIAAMGKIHSAILVKKMNFKALTVRTIIATIIGGIVGVLAALNGYGVFSLVCQQITFVSVATLLLFYGSKWRPSWVFSYGQVKSLIEFSHYVFIDQLLRQFFNRINTLFVGKIFPPAILGFYSRAESLNSLVGDYTSNSLRKVIFPVLSSVQDDEVRFRRIFFKSVALSAAVAATLGGSLFFMGETIIIGLLGEKWRGSLGIFKILVFVTFTAPHIGLISKSILSKGYAKFKFKMGLVQRLLLLLPLPLGFWYGIETFALGVTIAKILILFVFVLFAYKKLGFSVVRQLSLIAVPIMPFAVTILFFEFFLSDFHDIFRTVVFLVLQISFLIFIKHDIIDVVKEMVLRKKLVFTKNI
jgi:O-antigen/teichoic acid export membrane protein